ATQTVFIENVGIPTLAALRQAVDALEDLNMKGKVQLIVSGGIRSGADVAKALAMGADAVSIGQGILFALGCNHEDYMQKGKHHVHHLEREDLVALSVEAAAMARVPLAGTDWIPGAATA